MLKREEADYNRVNLQELLALPKVWIKKLLFIVLLEYNMVYSHVQGKL